MAASRVVDVAGNRGFRLVRVCPNRQVLPFAGRQSGCHLFQFGKTQRRRYLRYKAQKGESCEVGLEWQVKEVADDAQGDSRFTIIHPDGRKITDSPDVHIHASVAGDYRIVVSPNATKANYRYRITFIQL